ncbi:MAG: hypothetical protein J6M91_09300 [Methanobrevibacter sp.]|nr:hypothetical protein [Methanobrevibacter sp.]
MLENTNFWEHGKLDLFLNNKPTHAYVPKSDVKKIYELSQQKITDDGKIPIGIDHLPEDVINNNPILSKLDLLHVGDITAVEYDANNDTVRITEANITNPLIKKLYDDGELESVSIVSQVKTRPCPKNKDMTIIDTQSIDRVDIVGVGACESCNIPRPNTGSNSMVYARKPLNKEDENMAEELTIEQIEELFDKKFDEKLEPITERIDAIEEEIKDDTTEGGKGSGKQDEDELAAMRAEIDKLKKDKAEEMALAAANAKVEIAIREGKIKPADKENMVAFAKSSSEAFDAYIKDAEVIVPLGARQSLPGEDDSDEITDEDEALIDEINNAYNGDD